MAAGNRTRVLVYRLGSLGDHLVAVPSYRLVRRAFPGAEVTLLTNVPVANKAAAAEAVLTGSGLVDGYLTYVVGERSPLALLRLVLAVRRLRPEVLVYLAGARGVKAARRDRMFFRLCGVTKIVGLPETEELQRNRETGERVTPFGRMPWSRMPWFEQEGLRLARCVAELGDARVEEPASWAPGLTDAERAEAAKLLQPMGGRAFFAMSLGTKAQANHWGAENWGAVAERLSARYPGHGLVMLGAASEAEECAGVAAAWAGRVLNLCGGPTPRVSAAVMERAAAFLGHDSGPAHMAAAVGTKVVGVFGARNPPGEWVPYGEHVRVVLHWVDCGGCRLETCVVEKKKCIVSIGVDEVMAAVEELVGASGGASGGGREADPSLRSG